tara:strand:+ start:9390 stop:11270 length:1881 start_codon:yes stop_codon:yes gene_type:complete
MNRPHKVYWFLLVLAGIFAFSAEWINWFYPQHGQLVFLLSALAILLAGLKTYKKGFVALIKLNLNINSLMTIAVTGAMAIGQWPEASMVMLLFTVSEIIEEKAIDRSRKAVQSLMAMAPKVAMVLENGNSWVKKNVKEVPVGSIVRVMPGELISLDGHVIKGNPTVNQASITGESVPIVKKEGDLVFAGTINESGEFQFCTNKTEGNSTLARITHLVEDAQSKKAPTQKLIDQFAAVYTPIVFFISISVAIFPPLLFGYSWQDWIYRALVLLVIACPCALVISIPITIVSGLATAAHNGILVKGGTYLEKGRKLTLVAFDKTGTLTEDTPSISNFIVLQKNCPKKALLLAASLAERSNHPVSRAITNYARGAKVLKSLEVDEFKALPGFGIKGVINGESYYLGSPRISFDTPGFSREVLLLVKSLEEKGQSISLLLGPDGPTALFCSSASIKEGSERAISELHKQGVKTLMLSGDNTYTAELVAEKVGIDRVYGDLQPEGKLEILNKFLVKPACVGMVGDGINDAPALALADIGFAMAAAGSDAAIEAADVSLMDDDLDKIPLFIKISRKSVALLSQNIGLSIFIKVLVFVLGIFGYANMLMAIFADIGVSLICIFNGLRILRLKK